MGDAAEPLRSETTLTRPHLEKYHLLVYDRR